MNCTYTVGQEVKELEGRHTCKNLHKIFPHDPAELMHDVFQETHLKQKQKHVLSYALA